MAEYGISGPWMLQVNWTIVVVKGNKFVTGVTIKVTFNSKKPRYSAGLNPRKLYLSL